MLKTVLPFLISLLFVFPARAQRVHVGIAGGLSNYNGDLLDKLYLGRLTNGFIGVTAHYELFDQLLIRGAFNFARVNGNDRFSEKQSHRRRNLQFESAISELSVVGEFYLFNLYEKRFSPYAFAGIALFHFNPYTYDTTKRRYFLRPLSTEGQGIYPEKKPYSLWQPAIPFGGGVKFAVTDNIRVGIELGIRKIFTDYLDDVSTTYPDYNDLFAAKGQTAVDLSYRGGELPGGNPVFPNKGTQRGSADQKDIYFFTGLNISFLPFAGSGGTYRVSGRKSKYGCPTVPM